MPLSSRPFDWLPASIEPYDMRRGHAGSLVAPCKQIEEDRDGLTESGRDTKRSGVIALDQGSVETNLPRIGIGANDFAKKRDTERR